MKGDRSETTQSTRKDRHCQQTLPLVSHPTGEPRQQAGKKTPQPSCFAQFAGDLGKIFHLQYKKSGDTFRIRCRQGKCGLSPQALRKSEGIEKAASLLCHLCFQAFPSETPALKMAATVYNITGDFTGLIAAILTPMA
jgi:hypothetical protein